MCILSLKNWKINTLSSKNIQTEKAENPLILTEREERKTRYFPPKSGIFDIVGGIGAIYIGICIKDTVKKIAKGYIFFKDVKKSNE